MVTGGGDSLVPGGSIIAPRLNIGTRYGTGDEHEAFRLASFDHQHFETRHTN